MNKNKIFANLILAVHLILVLIILFGWHFPKIKYVYLATLIVTLLSELLFGYCLLTKWEFDFRKKSEPTLDYDYAFLSYYAHKVGIKISYRLIKYAALLFLVISLIIFYVRSPIYS